MHRSQFYFPAALVLVLVLVLVPHVLTGLVDIIETDGTLSEKAVRHSNSLCAAEGEYVENRKRTTMEALRKLDIQCTASSVPHIALAASGGGQRSAVGLVGFLHQMQQEGLLDVLLYLGGVSGSTWSMASLYSDPQWSTNMDAAVARLLGEGVTLEQALAWLTERTRDENFSLSDIWGVLTSAGIMKQMDLRRLSDEASRNETNPYPIYSAIEKFCFTRGPAEGKWFEITPHEAGFTDLELFVNTSLLGSKFRNGELLEKTPEMDMVQLQGVFGCALAHEEMLRDVLPPWLKAPEYLDDSVQDFLRFYNALYHMMSMSVNAVDEPEAAAALRHLLSTLEGDIQSKLTDLQQTNSTEQKQLAFKQQINELLSVVQTWSQNLKDGPFKTHVSVLINQVLPLLVKWEWGTTGNFLYQYEGDSVPPCLASKERIHLVDAGLLINVAYPPFLGDKRDIDLILAPEFSAGDMFETLTLARDYAAALNKAFPVVEEKLLEDKELPESCYVIEGKGKEPTIVYMPLFNKLNCKDAEEFKTKMEEFSTFQGPFSRAMIDSVLEVSKQNMKNNRDTLLSEIKKAALRRQSRNANQ